MKQLRPISNCLLVLISLLLLSSCKENEEHKVKEACNTFIKARIELNNGNSTLLENITEEQFFKLIMMNRAYDKAISGKVIQTDLDVKLKSVELTEDCAVCTMNGFQPYTINLCKEGELWKVKGENGHYPTPEKIARIKKKIEDHKAYMEQKPARDSVQIVLNTFFNNSKNYFRKQTADPLNTTCSKPTLDLLKRLRKYAFKKFGSDIIIEEAHKPDAFAFDIFFENGEVQCKFYKENIWVTLKKNGQNNYHVTGFNKTSSETITDDYINNQYIRLLRAVHAVRSDQYRNKDIK